MTETSAGSIRPPCTREDAERVLRTLRENGHVAYFAGGCVRDLLMNKTPKDWDVATDAPPPRVRELFRKTQSVGAAFGVILVRESKSVVEVATFRSDGAYKDGRHPSEVKFTTAEEDAQRRDFTINGLFLDPLDDNKVIDFVGGQADIAAKVIRAIGEPDRRFEEDHLRLLRAVRFAARFDFAIEPKTADAIRKHAPQLIRISPERIAEELRLMLTPPTRVGAWQLLTALGLSDTIFRTLEFPWGKVHPGVAPGRTFSLTASVARAGTIASGYALALVVLDFALHSLPHLGGWERAFQKLNVRAIGRSLRQLLHISNEESDAIEGTLYGLIQMIGWKSPSIATLKRFLARPTTAFVREIAVAIPPESQSHDELAQVEATLSVLAESDFAPAPMLTGDDLTSAGFQPGPKFKRVLDAVYDAQLEDQVTSREEGLSMARALFASSD